MCLDSSDFEPCDVWTETERRARKAHRCDSCKGEIPAGSRYTVHFSVFDGGVTSEKCCTACELARACLADHNEGVSYVPGETMRLLSECAANARGADRDQWEAHLRGMRERGEGGVR